MTIVHCHPFRPARLGRMTCILGHTLMLTFSCTWLGLNSDRGATASQSAERCAMWQAYVSTAQASSSTVERQPSGGAVERQASGSAVERQPSVSAVERQASGGAVERQASGRLPQCQPPHVLDVISWLASPQQLLRSQYVLGRNWNAMPKAPTVALFERQVKSSLQGGWRAARWSDTAWAGVGRGGLHVPRAQ